MEKAKPIGACLPAEGDEAGGEDPGRPCGHRRGAFAALYLHIQRMYVVSSQQEVFTSHPRCCWDVFVF